MNSPYDSVGSKCYRGRKKMESGLHDLTGALRMLCINLSEEATIS